MTTSHGDVGKPYRSTFATSLLQKVITIVVSCGLIVTELCNYAIVFLVYADFFPQCLHTKIDYVNELM